MEKLKFENFGQTTSKFEYQRFVVNPEAEGKEEEKSNLVKRSLHNSKSNFKISQMLETDYSNNQPQIMAGLKKSLLCKREDVEKSNFLHKFFNFVGYNEDISNSPSSAMRSRVSNSPNTHFASFSYWNYPGFNLNYYLNNNY